MRIRRNSNPYRILKSLALGSGFLIISTISPMSGALLVRNLIKHYFRRKSFEKHRLLDDLKNLQTRELIDYRDLGDGKIKITLTRAGKEKTLVYQLDSLHLKKPKRWDGKWRLVMFDIPHAHKKARDAFRKKLRDLHFYPIQKSVFLSPFPCEDEIDFLASIFDVQDYILLMYVSNFEGEKKLKNHFEI